MRLSTQSSPLCHLTQSTQSAAEMRGRASMPTSLSTLLCCIQSRTCTCSGTCTHTHSRAHVLTPCVVCIHTACSVCKSNNFNRSPFFSLFRVDILMLTIKTYPAVSKLTLTRQTRVHRPLSVPYLWYIFICGFYLFIYVFIATLRH